MSTKTARRPRTMSRNCHEDRHHRCLGTVYIYPPVDGRWVVPCECTCGHTEIQR